MPKGTYRARCVDCRRIAAASPATRWCDRCGGELKPVKYGTSRRRRRA